jgi:hypothetical protein
MLALAKMAVDRKGGPRYKVAVCWSPRLPKAAAGLEVDARLCIQPRTGRNE